MRYVSFSEIDSLQRCPRKWHYAYELGLRPRRVGRGLSLGRVLAKTIPAWWQSDEDAVRKALVDWEEEKRGAMSPPEFESWAEDERETARWLMNRYHQFYEPVRKQVEVLEVERKIRVPLPHPRGGASQFGIFGFGDMLVRWNGRIWLWEVKTMSQWGRDELVEMDPQLSTYALALRAEGVDVFGIVFDCIKTYRWKKDRPLSDSFRRYLVDRSDAQLKVFADETYESATRIEAEAKRTTHPRVIVAQGPMSCGGCFYREPCFESAQGFNDEARALIEEEYTTPEQRREAAR